MRERRGIRAVLLTFCYGYLRKSEGAGFIGAVVSAMVVLFVWGMVAKKNAV